METNTGFPLATPGEPEILSIQGLLVENMIVQHHCTDQQTAAGQNVQGHGASRVEWLSLALVITFAFHRLPGSIFHIAMSHMAVNLIVWF